MKFYVDRQVKQMSEFKCLRSLISESRNDEQKILGAEFEMSKKVFIEKKLHVLVK